MIYYFLCLAIGFLAKAADELEKRKGVASYASAIGYGVIAGVLANAGKEFSALVFAVFAGVLLSGKIDSKTHQTGVGAFTASIALLGFEKPELILFTVFTLAAVADEKASDFADNLIKERKRSSMLKAFLQHRIVLIVSALITSVYYSNIVFFAAIALSDLGYLSAESFLGNNA